MQSRPENPAIVFEKLSKPTGVIRELWDAQKESIEKYHSEFVDKRMVAFNLATGSGKSIIGLLILETWRAIGKRVAILTSSNALCSDLEKRCRDLGIASVIIKRKSDEEPANRERINNIKAYKRGQAVAIMNYWVYMSGKKDIAEPDILVIDDADNFETVLINQSSVTISRESDTAIWEQIWGELSKHRIYQNIDMYAMGHTRDESELIYFTHSIQIAEKIRTKIVSKPRSELSDELFWRFDENKDKMVASPMYMSGDSVIFSPFINSGVKHERLKNVQQIIFMSATLGTTEMLHRMMGSEDTIHTISESDLKHKLGTMGERIIFPIDEITSASPDDSDLQQAILQICENFKKVLIMTPSKYDSRIIQKLLESNHISVIHYDSESDVEKFAKSQTGVLVSGGRLVGLDLPDDACRVAVVTRMPFVVGPADGFSREVLEDFDYVNEKVGHRLVQAAGRCNRSPTDYAIYFVLDSRLASDILGDEKLFTYFPMRMKAELDYGQEFASTGGLSRAIEIGRLFLSRKLPGFHKDIESRIMSTKEGVATASGKPFGREIRAWNSLVERRSYLDAARDFELSALDYQGLSKSDELISKQIAWMNYLAAFAYYLAFRNFGNTLYKQKVIDNLESAIKNGQNSWFSGLQVIIDEINELKEKESVIHDLGTQFSKERILRGWNEFEQSNKTKKRSPRQQWQTNLEVLQNGTHNNVTATLKIVLDILGYEIRNLSGQQGKPDLLAFGNGNTNHLLLIEVKTKEEGGEVKSADVDQIGGHKIAYQKEYPNHKVYPVLFTNKEKFSQTAVDKARNNVRLVRATELVAFLNRYLELMEHGWKARILPEKIAVMQNTPIPDDIESLFEPADEPQISVEDFEEIIDW